MMEQIVANFSSASSAVSPAAPSERNHRLSQIKRRDPAAEGQFWCSVITTGVYCRPSCPARHARPENIRIHDTLEEARATGFRPCRRCNPEAPPLVELHDALIRSACRLLETNPRRLSSQQLADAVGLSRSHFHKLFRRQTGTTPFAYARAARRGVMF